MADKVAPIGEIAAERHYASLRVHVGPVGLDADIHISTKGLVAVGALVSMVLLSVVPIVWVSTRRWPEGAMPRRRKRRHV